MVSPNCSIFPKSPLPGLGCPHTHLQEGVPKTVASLDPLNVSNCTKEADHTCQVWGGVLQQGRTRAEKGGGGGGRLRGVCRRVCRSVCRRGVQERCAGGYAGGVCVRGVCAGGCAGGCVQEGCVQEGCV